MVATNDDILNELKKISNMISGLYGNQELCDAVKNSSDVKQTITEIRVEHDDIVYE